MELATLEALAPEAVAGAIEVQHLHLRAFAIDEGEQLSAERVFGQLLLDQGC